MVNTFHHRRGGDAAYALGLSALLEGAGHEVIPFAMRHPQNEPSVWEGHFPSWIDYRDLQGLRDRLRALPRFIYSRESARALDGLLAQVKPDVVHLHHVHHHLTPSVVDVAQRRGIPVVWTVHDYELICPAGLLFSQGAPCEACRGHRYDQAIARRCKRDRWDFSALAALEKALHAAAGLWSRIDRFLCPSQFLADRLMAFGVPPERVFHQPNFVDAPVSPPAMGSGWLFAGRLSQEKGVEVLLQAARRLPGRRLDVVGSGPLEARMREDAATLSNVAFFGHVSKEALNRKLTETAVVAVPSVWYENQPFAVTEAQAAGRAVVASRIGGIPELVEDGVDGVLVPPGDPVALADAVESLLSNPTRLSSLGESGHRRVRAALRPDAHLDAILGHYAAVGVDA